jgi:outer membrane protein assembly factor BamB
VTSGRSPRLWAVARWVWLGLGCLSCDKPVSDHAPQAGDVLWRVPFAAESQEWLGIPAASAGLVYIDVENAIHAYEIRSGREVWRTPIRTVLVPESQNLVASAGLLLVADPTGVIALDAVSGALQWKVSPDDSIIQAFGAADETAYYIGTRGQNVHALRLPSGTLAWSTHLSGPDWVKANVIGVAVSGDTVYASGIIRRTAGIKPRDIFIIALDRNSGRELWRYETNYGGDHVLYAAPLVTSDFVIVPDERERVVFALDRWTGTRRWNVYTDSLWGGPGPIPYVADGVVYFGSSDQYIYAVSLNTGALVWKTKTVASITHVVACRDHVFGNNQGVEVLDRRTGRKLRELIATPDEFPTSHFIVLDDRVIISGVIGIYAIRC